MDFARLARDVDARKLATLNTMVVGIGNQGENVFTEIARLETNQGPLDRGALTFPLDQMDQRQDTADFAANAIVRIVYQYGSSPLIPPDLRQRADTVLQGFRYWLDEPNPDDMTFWSENHQILFATSEYLAGHLYPQQVFSSSGLTGAQHEQKAHARVLRWLAARERWGMSEWFSPVYYEYDLLALFNLADFAPDPDVQTRACMAIDLILFDLARLSNGGSFGTTAGRAYAEQKFSGWGQSVGDLMEILWGTRGRISGRGSPAATSFAVTRGYRAPHALLGIGLDSPARLVLHSRQGLSFADAPAAGVGFQTGDDAVFWWGMGAYTTKETIVLTRHQIQTWGLQNYGLFKQVFGPLSFVPDPLLPFVADTLSPLTEGSFLSSAPTTTFRSPDAMLSSVESWRKGQVGFQVQAWQATLGMDAVVFTTMPGNMGHDGPDAWTGSASLPRVVQSGNVLVALYNPAVAEKVLFPQQLSHAYFPQAAFDEVATSGSWTFGRKGSGYVALFSAQPTTWTTSGSFAQEELVAPGSRNVWICQVGRAAEDGSFADFQQKILAAALGVVGNGSGDQADPLHASFAAPGVGQLEVDWSAAPTLGGNAVPEDYQRWETPYVTAPVGSTRFTIQYAGATLDHDGQAGTRAGTGL